MSSPPATILPDPEHLRLQSLCSDDRGILATVTVTVTAIAPSSRCPSCPRPSRHVHSRYVRHLSDLPWHGIAFRLHLQARRFFCDQADCSRRIFAERLPRLVAPSARTTLRLAQVLHQVAVALGGAAGRRLVATLGVSGLCQRSTGVSRDTLLRLVRRTGLPAILPQSVVGIDDFAFRRRQGGTILVDLERHRVVDLVEQSSTTAAIAWLEQHPEIAVLSRDRGESYVEAARRAAPHALQVADRWHILHNLSEVTQAVLERHRADLRVVAHAIARGLSPLSPPAQEAQDSPPAGVILSH